MLAGSIGPTEILLILAILLLIGLPLWAVIDTARRPDSAFKSGRKAIWIGLLVAGFLVGFGWVVALVYFFVARKTPATDAGNG